MRSRMNVIVAALLAVAIVAYARAGSAAEIIVFSTPTLKGVLEEVGPVFERTSGDTLRFTFDAVSTLNRRIQAGDNFDVAILLPAQMDELVPKGMISPASRVDVSRAAVGVGVHAGTPKPDVTTVDAFRHALVTARSMSYYPESASGAYFAGLFDRLGIPEAKSRLVPMKGKAVMDAVAAGNVDFTVITVPNIIDVPGIELAGLLPEELQNYTVYTSGICTSSTHADRAAAFIAFLEAPDVAAVLERHGMEKITR